MFYHKQKTPEIYCQLHLPSHSKKVQQQHQIDLVDMRNMQVEYNDKLFRYVLSLMDTLSRFHWLVPLEIKRNKCVKKELARIYSVHGIPERLQSDNGGEFKKDVEKFCIKSKIKMLRCHSYNPRVLGKVERSHCVLRQKICYNLMTHKKSGVNWVRNLPQYVKCCNHE